MVFFNAILYLIAEQRIAHIKGPLSHCKKVFILLKIIQFYLEPHALVFKIFLAKHIFSRTCDSERIMSWLTRGLLAFVVFTIEGSRASCNWNYISISIKWRLLIRKSDIFYWQDQNAWPDEFCQDGNKQSPITIDTHEVKYEHEWNPLRFIMWDEYPESMTILNNGNTVQVSMVTRDCKPMPSVC